MIDVHLDASVANDEIICQGVGNKLVNDGKGNLLSILKQNVDKRVHKRAKVLKRKSKGKPKETKYVQPLSLSAEQICDLDFDNI